MKNKMTFFKKSLSVLLAVVMLVSVFSVITISAADSTTSYYKTIATQDYEKAQPKTQKAADESITTALYNGSFGYLVAKPDDSATPLQELAIDEGSMNASLTYTLSIDFYIAEYQANESNPIFSLGVGANNGYEDDSRLYPSKSNYNLNEWYTISQTFTTNSNNWTQFKYNIWTFGGAVVVYDNAKIVDADGNVVFSENFETEKYTLTTGYEYVKDYSKGGTDGNDKALYINNDTGAQIDGTVGEGTSLGKDGTTTQYTVSFDYMILNKSTNTDYDLSLQVQKYCAVCTGGDTHKIAGEAEFYLGDGISTGVWNTQTGTITITGNCTNVYARIYVENEGEVLIDNIKFIDINGNVAKEYNMDGGTVTGTLINNDCAEIITKNKLLWINGIPNAVDGHLYVDAIDLTADNKDIPVDFTISEDITSDEYPYVNFRYRLLEGTTAAAGANMLAISLGSYSGNAIQWFNIPASYTAGEWLTVEMRHFGGVSYTAGDVRMNIHVYPGVEIEIDDIEIHRNENYGGATLANINFADNGTFTECSSTQTVSYDNDYGLLIDNENSTSYLEFHMHQLDIYDYPYAPAGQQYTVEFDFYALATGSFRFIYGANPSDWSGSSTQTWSSESQEIEVGQWKTIAITFTPSKEICYQKLWIYGGIKGYLDNFRLIGSNGVIYTDYQYDDATLGKNYTSGTSSATIVDLNTETYNGTTIAETKNSADYAILIDNTPAQANTDYAAFHIHELGYSRHACAPTGLTYTVSFDFYALETGYNQFIYSANPSNWSGGSCQVWSASGQLVQNQWKTITISNINPTLEIAYQKLYTYGGVKGYLDNFKLVASDGTVYTDWKMTNKDLGKTLTKNNESSYATSTTHTIVAMPADVAAAKNPVEVSGDNYTVSFIQDGVGIPTYGSNGVLKIAPTTNRYYNINNANFGVNFVEGNKYRLSFDYDVTKLAPGGYYFAVTNVNGSGNHKFINSTATEGTSNTLSLEFTFTGSLDFVIYGEGEVIFDNFVIEELVDISSSEVLPVQLQTRTYVSGAETYVDVVVNTSVSEKNFTFNLAYNYDYVECVQATSSEASADVEGVNDGEGNVAVTVASTDKNWLGVKKAIDGKIALLTFQVYEGIDADIDFTISDFNGLTMDPIVSTVSVNTVVTSLSILKRETTDSTNTLTFGMNVRVADGSEYIYDAEYNSVAVQTKGFLIVKGRHLDGELSFDAEYNPFVKNIAVETAEASYDTHNVYTLAVTATPNDPIIAARPYVIDANGVTYYGDMIVGAINDLADYDYNEWLIPDEKTSATSFTVSSTAAQTWQGANAISQGFIYTNGYTDEQIETELNRIDDMDLQMVRSYYDQSFSAKYDVATDSVVYDWDTEEMQGLVKWISAMQERGIEVALNMCWSVSDVWNNHCTTYTYDDCDDTCREGGIETSNNAFWCLRNVDGGVTTRPIAAYGDWVAESLDYLVNDCGLTNVKYLIMFTEPRQDYAADGSFTGQWTDYYKLVKSANDALETKGIRDNFEMVGPNIGFTYDSTTSYIDKMDTFFTDGAEYNITEYIDIYSFHLYAPSWPDAGNDADNPKDDNYDLYAEHFTQFISTVNTYDSGSDFWLDEWNYSGMFIDSPYYATQLAQAVVAALNTGVENVMLWQLFETKWPERSDTGGEFVNGTHAMGLAPTLTESEVPFDVYYGYTLLTKFMGRRGATVYAGNGYDGVYSAMIENTDGTQSILVINTNTSEKVVNLTVNKAVNGTLFRHIYDPATVAPTAEAEIIKADKAFVDISGGLVDTLPAGAIAVYTTDLSLVS